MFAHLYKDLPKAIHEGYYFHIYLSLDLPYYRKWHPKGKESLLGFTDRTLSAILISSWAVDYLSHTFPDFSGFCLPRRNTFSLCKNKICPLLIKFYFIFNQNSKVY